MRTFLITQICFMSVGIFNAVPGGDWNVSPLFNSVSAHHSHTTTNLRQAEEPKSTALAKNSIWQPRVHVGTLEFSRVYRPPFVQNVLLREYGEGSSLKLMRAYLDLLDVQTNRKGPPYTFPKFDEYGDLPFTKEKERLDYFAQELKSVKGEPGYIIEYRNRRKTQKPLARAKRAKEYLVKVKGVEANRILLVNGGYQRDFKIELRLGPLNSP